jgi:hypothetical protein
MVNRDGAAPSFLCRSVSLVEMRVMANQTVDLVGIQYAVVISLVQYFVAAVDAFQLRIIWKLYAVPAVGFCKACFTQATHGVCCDVSASVKGLVVAQFY